MREPGQNYGLGCLVYANFARERYLELDAVEGGLAPTWSRQS